MRFMMLVKATKDSESGALPTAEQIECMGKFNEEMVKAGVLLDAAGLHPSEKGTRIKFSAGKRTVIDGPFTETKELIAGFWMIQVKSPEEALEWAKRCPPPHPDGEIELRRVFDPADFEPVMTPELKEQDQRLRDELAAQKQK